MRQQSRATAAGGPCLRRRVLRLVLGVGALVAVWWFLTTGTAHAAESPVPRPVKALQEKAKPVADAKARVKTRVVAPAQAEVSRAVERADRTADRAVSQVEKTVQKVANTTDPVVGPIVNKAKQTVGKATQTAKATVSLGTASNLARDRAAERRQVSPADVARAAASSTSDSVTAPAADTDIAVASRSGSRSLVVDQHRTPKPTRTDADGSAGGLGGVATLQQADHLTPPAFRGTPVDSGHLRPVELAFPPGCSPD